RRHTRSKRDWSSDVCSSDLSARPPRTIPACDQIPLSGIGISVSVNAWSTAAKSSRSFDTKAPATFSHTAKAGYRLSVAFLISSRSEERRVGEEWRAQWAQ